MTSRDYDMNPETERTQWVPVTRRSRRGVAVLGILDHLAAKVPDFNDPPPEVDLPELYPAPSTAALEAGGTPVTTLTGDRLPPLFCVLRHRNQQGIETLRPVTLRREHVWQDWPALDAWVHDLKRHERFVVRDISDIYTQDGEGLDLGLFLHDLLGFSQERRVPSWVSPSRLIRAHSPGRPFRKAMRPALMLLCAAARNGEIIQPRSIAAIMRYLRREAQDMVERDMLPFPPAEMDFDMLENRIALQRPLREDISWALDQLDVWDEFRITRLGGALGALTNTLSVDFVGELRERMAGVVDL